MASRIFPGWMGWVLLIAAAIHARDWGFSKDTIIEWDETPNTRSSDSVWIINNGTDSLNFDSAWVEVVEPDNYQEYFYQIGFMFTTEQDFPKMYWGKRPAYANLGDSVPFVWPKDYVWINDNRPLYFYNSVIGSLKDNQVTPSSYRLVLRSIFRAKNRGLDTLVIVGDYRECINFCTPESVVSTKIKKRRWSVPQTLPYLLNGRRMKSIH